MTYSKTIIKSLVSESWALGYLLLIGRVLIEHGLTSAPTQYRLYSRRFLQAKRPNQQYQSTEGDNNQRKKDTTHITYNKSPSLH